MKTLLDYFTGRRTARKRSTRRFQPRLQPLEDRRLLAVTADVPPFLPEDLFTDPAIVSFVQVQEPVKTVEVDNVLDQIVPLDFNDITLEDAIEYLKTEHGLEIDLSDLDEDSFDPNQEVNFSGKMSLRSALKLLLGEANLTYMIQDEVLHISSVREDLDTLVNKVYPVGDLVVPIISGHGTDGSMSGAGGMGGGMGGDGLGGE